MKVNSAAITGIVLAGGRARRMGGVDKGLIEWRGRPLVAYALDAVRAVADTVLISANRNLERYAAFGCPVIADAGESFEGPLAGLLSGMKTASTPLLMTVPCDSPQMTGPLLARLVARLMEQDADVAAAHDGERLHPTFMLVKRELRADLENFLGGGERKVRLWLARHRLAIADYRDNADLFVNINTPEDLADLKARTSRPKGSVTSGRNR
ncbi:MAG: molybdenum cofactor guanylyltransferase [Methylotetracoccus sp.]|nr:molybdenum cofactor guanylyltransferase [Methylotetracoccus sp.]